MIADVRIGSIASISAYPHDVRFTPDSDQKADMSGCPLSANMLKKSNFASDRKFAEALVRSSRIYVGDLITNAILNGRPSQVPYRALH